MIGFTDLNTVQVFLVDAGEHRVVDWDEVRTLPARFRSLPRQAVPCKLADVKPADDAESFSGS